MVLAQGQGRAGTPTPQKEPHLPPLGPPPPAVPGTVKCRCRREQTVLREQEHGQNTARRRPEELEVLT